MLKDTNLNLFARDTIIFLANPRDHKTSVNKPLTWQSDHTTPCSEYFTELPLTPRGKFQTPSSLQLLCEWLLPFFLTWSCATSPCSPDHKHSPLVSQFTQSWKASHCTLMANFCSSFDLYIKLLRPFLLISLTLKAAIDLIRKWNPGNRFSIAFWVKDSSWPHVEEIQMANNF